MDAVWLVLWERPSSTGPRTPYRRFLHTLRIPQLMLCLFLFVVSADGTEAQQVVYGTVTERGSGQPIEGAMVVLLRGDQVVTRVLSTANGSFTMTVRRPGRYELRVDRIGYSSTFSEAFDVASGATVERRIETAVRPVRLRGLDVSGDRRCEVRPAGGLATATVWEEVRKALAAATWTSERELYRFAWIHYVRDLDAETQQVLDEERTRRRYFTPQPFESVDPDTLAAYGFVREQSGEVLYSAPDAAVLLSDSFLDGHCFALDHKSEDGRGFVGLRFEPIPARRLPDVRGVLWVDEENGRLESLEYEYVNLGRRAAVQGDDASGRMFFRELPNGTWIVEEWSIRMPRLVDIRDEFGRTRRYDVRGYVEEGGSVTRITTSAGVALNGTRTAIYGTVTDSVGSPAEGARVWIVGTDLEALTDAEGAFRLEDVGVGTWSLRASHPALAQLGHSGSIANVTVARDRVRQVRLGLPSISSFVYDRCRSSGSVDAESVILIGRVVHSDGAPAPHAAIRVVWTQAQGTYRRSFEGYGTDADSIGVFTVCEVPSGSSVIATASAGDELSGATELSLPDVAGVVPIEIGLARSIDAPIPTTREETSIDAGEEAAWLASVGFDLREDRALLHRTNREMIDLGYDTLLQVLSEIPRLEARLLITGEMVFRLHPTTEWSRFSDVDDSCELDFYLNGSLVRQRIDDIWEVQIHRMLEPRVVTGIEVFEGSSSPVGAPEDCGYILLWVTRLRHRDDPDFTGTVRGRVLGLGDLIPADSVVLRIQPGLAEARLDDQGRFDFGPLPPAVYVIEASIPDWGTWSTQIELRARAAVDVVIEVVSRLRGRDRSRSADLDRNPG